MGQVTPYGTTPPAEAVEVVMVAMECEHVDHHERPYCDTEHHSDEPWFRERWTDEGCAFAVSVAAAVVAALRLPERDRETAAKALDEAERAAHDRHISHLLGGPDYPTWGSVAGWLHARASALREGRADG